MGVGVDYKRPETSYLYPDIQQFSIDQLIGGWVVVDDQGAVENKQHFIRLLGIRNDEIDRGFARKLWISLDQPNTKF